MKEALALYRRVLDVFPAGGKRFLSVFMWLLASLSVFDAAALGLLALVIGPAAAGQEVVLPLIGPLDSAGIIWAIFTICALMISKGLLAILLNWWVVRRVPEFEVAIGDRLLTAYLFAPWEERLRKNSNDIMRFADNGVDVTVNAFVLPGATLLGEAVSLLVIILTLGIVQPVLALTTLVYVLLIAAVLFYWIARRARHAGEVNAHNSIRTSRLILEIIASMKEIALQNKEREVAGIVKEARTSSAVARAHIYFLGQLPRYALEAGLVGGFLIVGGVGLLLGGVEQAIAAVALFGLAGFRVAPSVIRFQSVLSQMIALSEYPRLVLAELDESERTRGETLTEDVKELPSSPQAIELRGVTFSYKEAVRPALDDVSLRVPMGSSVAIVGESGSGKSTLVDLILSLLEPTKGQITVGDVQLRDVRTQWRSRVGYVPQDVVLFDATIAQNVALTWGTNFDVDRVEKALRQSQLWDFVASNPQGIQSRVGERGLALSGGQRQRLGIARALYREPLVLVLDEATSALDTKTESQVSASIRSLDIGITKIVVAHRLATIMHSDIIFLLKSGHLLGSGDFKSLVARYPEFARQAELAGLA